MENRESDEFTQGQIERSTTHHRDLPNILDLEFEIEDDGIGNHNGGRDDDGGDDSEGLAKPRHHDQDDDRALPADLPNGESSSNPYYLRAFQSVIQLIRKQYVSPSEPIGSKPQAIQQPNLFAESELKTYELFQSLSIHAQKLYVRMYRRKFPTWFRIKELRDRYPEVQDVESCVQELVHAQLINRPNEVFEHVAQNENVGLFCKRENQELIHALISALDVNELKLVCDKLPRSSPTKRTKASSPPNSKVNRGVGRFRNSNVGGDSYLKQGSAMREQIRSVLIVPAEEQKTKKRNVQMTLTGLPLWYPAFQRLISISSVRTQMTCISRDQAMVFRRMHAIYHLMDPDGMDSSRLLLMEVGRIQRAPFKINSSRPIFKTREEFLDYLAARDLWEFVEPRVYTPMTNEEKIDYEKEVLRFGQLAEDWISKVGDRTCLVSEENKLNALANDLGIVRSSAVEIINVDMQDDENQQPANQEPQSSGRTVEQGDHGTPKPQHQSILDLLGSQYKARSNDTRLDRIPVSDHFWIRFRADSVYAQIAWRSVSLLERHGLHEKAVHRLYSILKSGLLPLKRGKFFNRLSIDLFEHLDKADEALQVCLQGLSNSECLNSRRGDRLSLARRAVRIAKKIGKTLLFGPEVTESDSKEEVMKNKKKGLTKGQAGRRAEEKLLNWSNAGVKASQLNDSLPNVTKIFRDSANWTKIPVRTILGKPLDDRKDVGKHSTFIGFNNELVSTEQLALQHYQMHGNWKGVHCEGSIISTLFGLILWDIIFFPILDMFHVDAQDAPLDFGCEMFYLHRRDLLEKLFEDIRHMEGAQLAKLVEQSIEDHRGLLCRGVSWSGVVAAFDLPMIARVMGSTTLVHILRLLCVDFEYWSGGFPDLTLWRESESGGEIMFVEVKGPRDSMMDRQKAWMHELLAIKVNAEILCIKEKETVYNSKHLHHGI